MSLSRLVATPGITSTGARLSRTYSCREGEPHSWPEILAKCSAPPSSPRHGVTDVRLDWRDIAPARVEDRQRDLTLDRRKDYRLHT